MMVQRPHPTTSMSLFVLSPPSPSPSSRADVVPRERNRLPIDEEEDRVLPLPASNFCRHVQRTSSSSMSKPKSRRGTLTICAFLRHRNVVQGKLLRPRTCPCHQAR